MLKIKNIMKSFSVEGESVSVLYDISLNLEAGDFLSIVGRSGSGKSTLLNVLSTLVRPDGGEITYRGEDLAVLSDSRLDQLRRADFSIVFQFHHLLPYLTVLENTLLPFMGSFKPVSREIEQKAMACLERVGLADKAKRLPGNMSGGEQQRVAIARALVKSSQILFADEPTGSLDRKTGEGIMELLSGLHKEGMTIVMVTHEQDYARCAGQIIELEDGKIISCQEGMMKEN